MVNTYMSTTRLCARHVHQTRTSTSQSIRFRRLNTHTHTAHLVAVVKCFYTISLGPMRYLWYPHVVNTGLFPGIPVCQVHVSRIKKSFSSKRIHSFFSGRCNLSGILQGCRHFLPHVTETLYGDIPQMLLPVRPGIHTSQTQKKREENVCMGQWRCPARMVVNSKQKTLLLPFNLCA